MSTEAQEGVPTSTEQNPETAAADAAAFAAGFAEVRGDEPPTPSAASTAEPEATAAAAPEEKPDAAHNDDGQQKGEEAPAAEPAKPDPLLEKLSRLEQLLGATESRIRNVEGRFGSLNGEIQSLKKSVVAPAPAPAPAAEIPSTESLEQLKNDYPEWGKAIDEAITAAVARATAALKPGETLSEDTVAQITAAAERNTGMKFLETHHRGWREQVKTPEFAQWHMAQPPEVQQLAFSDDPFDAIALLDAFRAAPPKPAAPAAKAGKEKLEAAVAVGRKPAQPASVQISDEDAFALGFKQARAGAS